MKYVDDLKDFYEKIIAKMPGHVYWKDLNGNYLGCNDAQAKALNLTSRKEILNKKPYENLSSKKANILHKIDKEVLSTGKTLTKEEPGIREDGSVGLFLTKKIPLYGHEEDIVGLLGVSFDITDSKKLELEREKGESMKMLASSIVHQLNTPLSAIQLLINQVHNILSASMSSDSSGEIKNIASKIISVLEKQKQSIHSAKYTMKVIQNNIKNAKIEEVDLKKHQMGSLLKKFVETYPLTDKQRSVVNLELSEDFNCLADKDLFFDVMANLMTNAIQHMDIDQDCITVELLSSDKNHQLIFEDTGEGISNEILPHIFERFYTKTPNGSGIGLAFCRQVMQTFGGSIVCESELGKFTRFILLFPLIQE